MTKETIIIVRGHDPAAIVDAVEQADEPGTDDVFAEVVKAVLRQRPDIVRIEGDTVEIWPSRSEKGWKFTLPKQDRPRWALYKGAILDGEQTE